jgi:4'-phosphopantetheinyl transferase
VHLWFTSLDKPRWQQKSLSILLNEDELLRAEKFLSERDRARFIVGRGLLRRILGYYTGVEPSQLGLSYGERGKPFLEDLGGDNPLHFGQAHSGGYILYAIAKGGEVGVDLERIEQIREAKEMAFRFFPGLDAIKIAALWGRKQAEAFFDSWTGREAYLKGLGCGLSIPLKEVDPHRWSLVQFRPLSDFVAAVAVESMSD